MSLNHIMNHLKIGQQLKVFKLWEELILMNMVYRLKGFLMR
jgi:hypothetical protein